MLSNVTVLAFADEIEKIAEAKKENQLLRAAKVGLLGAAGFGAGYGAATGAWHLAKRLPRIQQLEERASPRGKLKFWIPATAGLTAAALLARKIAQAKKEEALRNG